MYVCGYSKFCRPLREEHIYNINLFILLIIKWNWNQYMATQQASFYFQAVTCWTVWLEIKYFSQRTVFFKCCCKWQTGKWQLSSLFGGWRVRYEMQIMISGYISECVMHSHLADWYLSFFSLLLLKQQSKAWYEKLKRIWERNRDHIKYYWNTIFVNNNQDYF